MTVKLLQGANCIAIVSHTGACVCKLWKTCNLTTPHKTHVMHVCQHMYVYFMAS